MHDNNGEVIIFSTESFQGLRLNPVKLKLPSELASFKISEYNQLSNCDKISEDLQDENILNNDLTNVSVRKISTDLGTQNLEVKDTLEAQVDNFNNSSTYGLFVQDLYFVTKNGSMDSIHSKAMSWALNKISCETEFDSDLNDEVAVENLRVRVESRYPHLMSTYDLIQMYSTCSSVDQLFVVTEECK